MTEKLKPCPFCGGEAKTKHYEDNTSLIVYCPTCSKGWNIKEEAPGERWASDFEFFGWDSEDDDAVVAAWNRRAKQEREIGHSCIKGVFLDELDPNRGNMRTEVMPSCGFACEALEVVDDD